MPTASPRWRVVRGPWGHVVAAIQLHALCRQAGLRIARRPASPLRIISHQAAGSLTQPARTAGRYAAGFPAAAGTERRAGVGGACERDGSAGWRGVGGGRGRQRVYGPAPAPAEPPTRGVRAGRLRLLRHRAAGATRRGAVRRSVRPAGRATRPRAAAAMEDSAVRGGRGRPGGAGAGNPAQHARGRRRRAGPGKHGRRLSPWPRPAAGGGRATRRVTTVPASRTARPSRCCSRATGRVIVPGGGSRCWTENRSAPPASAGGLPAPPGCRTLTVEGPLWTPPGRRGGAGGGAVRPRLRFVQPTAGDQEAARKLNRGRRGSSIDDWLPRRARARRRAAAAGWWPASR